MFKKALLLFAFTPQLFAAVQGSQGSAASADLSGQGIGQIINGSGYILEAGSQFSITAIQTIGEFTFITLKTVGNSATVTLRLGSKLAGHALYGVGQIVQVVTTGAGTILTSAGHVVAFLPNEMGKSLIYNTK